MTHVAPIPHAIYSIKMLANYQVQSCRSRSCKNIIMRKFLAENQLEALSIPIANLKLHVTCFYKDRFLIFDYLDLCTAFVRHKETLVQVTFLIKEQKSTPQI